MANTNGKDKVACKICGKEFGRNGIAGHMSGHARKGEHTSPYRTLATIPTTGNIPTEIISAIAAKINHKDSTILLTDDGIYIYL